MANDIKLDVLVVFSFSQETLNQYAVPFFLQRLSFSLASGNAQSCSLFCSLQQGRLLLITHYHCRIVESTRAYLRAEKKTAVFIAMQSVLRGRSALFVILSDSTTNSLIKAECFCQL